MKGPKHYEGWSCEDCEYLCRHVHLYCNEPTVIESNVYNEIYNVNETPSWCPYLKDAIIDRVIEFYG